MTRAEVQKVVEGHSGKVPVVEIFKSIEGEGIRTGMPVVFVRFAGCNMSCSWCDTVYAQDISDDDIIWLTYGEIVKSIHELNCKNITFTGGEPLLYDYIIRRVALNYPEFDINVETNGSIAPFPQSLENLFFTMDCKCPSSGMSPTIFAENLRENDALKFVVGSEEDLIFVANFLFEHRPRTKYIYISPVFGKIELTSLVEFVKKFEFLNVRLQIQIHKIIWSPEQRGV